ncbi:type II secretion system F family protein [Hyphomicrobium sp.]|uniref:type II secretion system F family protein n=1 Tax=Hyphomicrobium sp. TaxID=82 RepID=UPI000FC110C2|nr:type II secretion system F family protein [Hyphomicrobium sp.]MBN9248762.1 type II secretion system F family protein [Hyphomicrobium sp.]RUP09379.1 MAG: type II secretion system F family protein [Hyphomicrobium sp.]
MIDVDLHSLLVPLLAALAFAGGVFALAYPYFADDRQAKRLESVSGVRGARLANAAGDVQSSRRKSVADTLKELENRENASKKVSLSLKLVRAGTKMKPREFYVASALLGALLASISVFIIGLSMAGTFVVAFVGGLGLPRWILNKMINRRQQKFVGQMANALDVVVRGIKSGLPLNECIQVISRESPEPLASEFREVVDQQRLGLSVGDGLERMCERMPLPEMRFLTIVISIQQQSGGNLSEALSNLSNVLRDRQMLALKVKALSAEAKASAMVLASLPPGVMSMVYLSSPGYMMPLFTTTIGHFMVVLGAVWMGMGVLIMRKMINFKF